MGHGFQEKRLTPVCSGDLVQDFVTAFTGSNADCFLAGYHEDSPVAGFAGFVDAAADPFDLKEYDEDLGQTLGSYGIGHGFFINWPVFGPSSVTDTIGSLGDAFLEPLNYVDMKTKYDLALQGLETVNKTSLRIGEYEDLKEAALDPYVAYRDAYYQYRLSETKK